MIFLQMRGVGRAMSNKIKCGIVGVGYISKFHIDAIRRIGWVDIEAVVDSNYELAKEKAREYFVPKCYKGINKLLADKSISVIHNCTPNNMHFGISEKIINSGKHIFSEKPLAVNSKEGNRLVELVRRNTKIVAGVNFNYRMNPLVQEIKWRIKRGDIGKPILVHGSYLQDWLLYETDYNWRVESNLGGPSRCIADIGSHWIDLAQNILGDKIVEVCSDLVTVHKIRKRPKTQVETFAKAFNIEYEDRKIDTEDYGSVMFKMKSGIHGVFYASEVSPGRKCYFNIEIDGTKSSVYWNQEIADWMWVGNREKDNMLVMRNPNLMTEEAKMYTSLAAGHPEGWNDALKNNIYSFYKFIADGKEMYKDHCDFATFEEANCILKITEAILGSNRKRRWQIVEN